MKVGDLAIVLPYEVKPRARWNNETRSEDYIGQCGTVTEIMEELCDEPLTPPQVYVKFGDGFVGSYSPDKLGKYNPLSVDEDYYIPVSYKGKQVEYRGEISDRESFAEKEEGIYYMISTGSFYCYYDGSGSLDTHYVPNPHNPEVADMKPCWYSELKESEDV